MLKFISVVGARPNFIKIAPIHKAFQIYKGQVEHKICHTGQHFDANMSGIFFDELEMPKPDFYLGISGSSHAQQTAKIMIEFEKILLQEQPDLVIVPGDVNSTLACSLVAAKMGIKIAHVESGLRSFDRSMPEEINRIVTDSVSDYLFVSEPSGVEHLMREGVDKEKIHFVGNVMIDSLIYYQPKIDLSKIHENLGIAKGEYILVTFHRPSNVDNAKYLKELTQLLNTLSEKRKIVFPIHPRTKSNIVSYGLMGDLSENILLTEPIGYIDFLSLIKNACLVVTDSGGIQEESTFLNIQCLTVRNNTERPVTVTTGTNKLIGTDLNVVKIEAQKILSGEIKKGAVPEMWDGKTAERIATTLLHQFAKSS